MKEMDLLNALEELFEELDTEKVTGGMTITQFAVLEA